jgi:hypothetical protein
VTDGAEVARVFAAIAHGPPSDETHLFLADITEMVEVRLGEPGDHLVIEAWTQSRGLRRFERR